jgi:lysophospholipase L1-like esterase
LSDGFGEVARTLGVPYLYVFERLFTDRLWAVELAAGDGSHPGRAGYELLARMVLGWRDWWFFDEKDVD